jgi:hypothetical protein
MANQIKKKFIGNDQVDGSKILLLEGQDIRKIVNGQEVRIIESLEQKIETEKQARIAGDLAVLSDAKAYTDSKTIEAKAYTDTKVSQAKAEILGGIDDATLDTIKEIADRLKSEEGSTGVILSEIGAVRTIAEQALAHSFEVEGSLHALEELNFEQHQQVNNRISSVELELSAEKSRALIAEQFLEEKILEEKTRALAEEQVLRGLISQEVTRAGNAEALLSSRIQSLESDASQFKSEKFVVTSAMIAAGFVDLLEVVIPDSLTATYDRLNMYEAEDFVLGVSPSGKTRITFVGNLVAPSEEALAVGDVLRFRYKF